MDKREQLIQAITQALYEARADKWPVKWKSRLLSAVRLATMPKAKERDR
jgi:hypothetical protein